MHAVPAFELPQITSSDPARKAESGRLCVADLPLARPLAASGLYVHVPFCFHKCHYCDFYSIVDHSGRHGEFAARLLAELIAFQELASNPPETVFFGGGTPTLLPPAHWTTLLRALRVAPGAEVTVEANPETVTEDLASVLSEGGVNRVSVGCQSFDPAHLKTLERWHEPASVDRSLRLLRGAGIERVNLDLIFAIPGQSLRDWRSDLQRAMALEPPHISCYGLTYEPNTALTARRRAGQIDAADEDLEAEMYELAIEVLAAAGYEHYEISAWARPGYRCRHNVNYWNAGTYWALGPGGSAHVAGWRWKNQPRLSAYLQSAVFAPIEDVEPPDPRRAASEAFMLGLRLVEGMTLERVDAALRDDPESARRRASIEHAMRGGLLERVGDRLRLTRRGLLLADEVVGGLV
jgi:oxygen-independent coproporphyrinogen-3 oxidase